MGWKSVFDSTRIGEILDLFYLFKDETIFMKIRNSIRQIDHLSF